MCRIALPPKSMSPLLRIQKALFQVMLILADASEVIHMDRYVTPCFGSQNNEECNVLEWSSTLIISLLTVSAQIWGVPQAPYMTVINWPVEATTGKYGSAC